MAVAATVTPAPSPAPPTSVSLHCRATVTGAAAALATFISGGLPKVVDAVDGRLLALTAVSLGAEAAGAACRVTWDGVTTPTDTLGQLIPTEPGLVRIAPDSMALVKLYSAGTTYLQVCFEYGS